MPETCHIEKMKPDEKTYENKQGHILKLKTPNIEVFKNIYSGRDFHIKLDILEFTAICPKTSLPDFGRISINYIPDEVCLELKSLKEYFLFYRNVGIFHENVVNKTLEDLVSICKPKYLRVEAKYNVRGGIETTIYREFQKE